MKKVLSLALVIIMCLSLCACSEPDYDRIISNANMIVSCKRPMYDAEYSFVGMFNEEDMTYTITMYADEEKIREEFGSSTTSSLIAAAKRHLDDDTGSISLELQMLRDSIVDMFESEDVDITVITVYRDRNGNLFLYE